VSFPQREPKEVRLIKTKTDLRRTSIGSFSVYSFEQLKSYELIQLFMKNPALLEDQNGRNETRILKGHLGQLALPIREVISLEQVHGNRTLIINCKSKLKEFDGSTKGDALFTDRKDIYLRISVADCLPIYVHDKQNHVIGLIHSGWRGTLMGIAANAIRTASRELGLTPGSCTALLGPSIKTCCYEVSKNVAILFPKDLIQERQESQFLDLAQANQVQLNSSGIDARNIFTVRHCTCCSPELYYSYRRTGRRDERMHALMGLK
jgi:YfiH family protein